MVKIVKCTYCGEDIAPGTGLTYVKNDGSIFNFCSKKCYKLKVVHKKPARKVRWTKFFGQR